MGAKVTDNLNENKRTRFDALAFGSAALARLDLSVYANKRRQQGGHSCTLHICERSERLLAYAGAVFDPERAFASILQCAMKQ
jgi:hypothetical protein